jgi:hypothetical protein
MTTQEMFAPSAAAASDRKKYARTRAPRNLGFWEHASRIGAAAPGRKFECDEEGCESDQIKMDIYIFARAECRRLFADDYRFRTNYKVR